VGFGLLYGLLISGSRALSSLNGVPYDCGVPNMDGGRSVDPSMA